MKLLFRFFCIFCRHFSRHRETNAIFKFFRCEFCEISLDHFLQFCLTNRATWPPSRSYRFIALYNLNKSDLHITPPNRILSPTDIEKRADPIRISRPTAVQGKPMSASAMCTASYLMTASLNIQTGGRDLFLVCPQHPASQTSQSHKYSRRSHQPHPGSAICMLLVVPHSKKASVLSSLQMPQEHSPQQARSISIYQQFHSFAIFRGPPQSLPVVFAVVLRPSRRGHWHMLPAFVQARDRCKADRSVLCYAPQGRKRRICI